MKLLVVNPNTDARVTAWLAEEARRIVRPGWQIEAVNADSGLAALETPEHIRIAADAVTRAVALAQPDAALIGAFGDPGLVEVRALGWRVAGLGEAGLQAAGADRRRFGIVTLGATMRDAIQQRVESLGLANGLVAIHILPGSVGDYVASREAREEELAGAVEVCAAMGAKSVLLGGAPFAGQAEVLRERVSVDMLDGVGSAVASTAFMS